MRLVILTGPQAVGKMTVGQKLERLTGLKLFHNHMTIDLVGRFLDYGRPDAKALVGTIRREMLRTIARSDLPGLIFTFVWAFDLAEDHAFVEEISAIFRAVGADVLVVELEANMDERLRRNVTENRLACKPSKRDTVFSEAELRESARHHRLNSEEGELSGPHYLRIDNTHLPPEDVARRIAERFGLTVREGRA